MNSFLSIRLTQEHGWSRAPADLTAPAEVELGAGLNFLDPARPLSIFPGPPLSEEKVLLLEPLPGARGRLLLINLSGRELRVNDYVAPPLAVLHERDQFRFDHGPAWQLALFHRPRIEPPAPEAGVVQCAVCLKTLTADDRCLWCTCGVAMHFRSELTAPGELACAAEGENCLSCGRSISSLLREGYSSEPDINRA